jgi:hypothetical protein
MLAPVAIAAATALALALTPSVAAAQVAGSVTLRAKP